MCMYRGDEYFTHYTDTHALYDAVCMSDYQGVGRLYICSNGTDMLITLNK